MKLPVYFVNSFTDQPYTGNPAAVCMLERHLPDPTLQGIAAEINLPVTTFLWKESETYFIRWFGPEYEIELCGHGTLAAGFVVLSLITPQAKAIVFVHPVKGEIPVARKDSKLLFGFPIRSMTPIPIPSVLAQGLGEMPKATYQYKYERIIAIFDDQETIVKIQPDRLMLKELVFPGIIITAQGNEKDIVSRTFYPRKSIFEDQVTGSSHCLLAPYWSKVLGKEELTCQQLSKRGGVLICEIKANSIFIHGEGKLFLEGAITL